MNTSKGWHLLLVAELLPIVTIAELAAATGLSRRSVRDLIATAGIEPVPGHGPHGALNYELDAVSTAVTTRPGKGNRRAQRSRTTIDRCSHVSVDTWATEHRAPRYEDRCPNSPTWYVGYIDDATRYMRLCDEHAKSVIATGYDPDTRTGCIEARRINP